MFVKVLLPLYLSDVLTYSVPLEMLGMLKEGIRVSVPLGNRKIYSGIIIEICENIQGEFEVKDIINIIDEQPVITPAQLSLWKWIAGYYMSTLGEVMKAALPAGLKLESETRVSLNPSFQEGFWQEMEDTDKQIIESLADKQLSMGELVKNVNRKNILPNIKRLLQLDVINIQEELKYSFKYKTQTFVKLNSEINSEEKLSETINSLKKAPKQEKLLLKYIEIAEPLSFNAPLEIPKDELLKESGVSASIYKQCETKGVFTSLKKEVERIKNDYSAEKGLPDLSPAQEKAFIEIQQSQKSVLLYGVTSSGKTEVYIKLIDEALKQNKQVLYLLPEIALTTQIINRLRAVFGNKTGIYHSTFSDAERTEIYNSLLSLKDKDDKGFVILGVRSSLLLPFSNLGLIIVDEEHETTYKQYDPVPRYNARDGALVLANMHGAKIVLGSATPSIESFYNAKQGKYMLVKLTERYGNAVMPHIRTIDMRSAYKRNKVVSHFSETLLNEIRETLEKGEQVILFQNRRGFSPFVQCNECGYVVKCEHCDVSLTYHKYNNSLTCHYCGYSIQMPSQCPACSSTDIKTKGFGTEKIEDELSILIPEARIERLDLDSTRSKFAYERILYDFEVGAINILIGTQMITKGLDFGNVSLVGIMNADNMLNFPDFRAYERSFQLMSQVSGRAGRKDKPGKVIIQTSVPENPVIRQVINYEYNTFYHTQADERRLFNYPPFCRLLVISLRHTKQDVVNKAGGHLKIILGNIFGKNVAGPEPPPVGRIQNKYILNFRIKLKKDAKAAYYKEILAQVTTQLKADKRYPGIQVIIDVDPN